MAGFYVTSIEQANQEYLNSASTMVETTAILTCCSIKGGDYTPDGPPPSI
jgi:hypothetical protein